ncbi:MAG: hypothetical protein HN929_07380 [Chloroflexi bacterium]|jgi:hypothetical protein|nr:hypothetical protein [Chloroflexota bacterium]MBT7081270.1 hypothetical protein [Chloroflexota bacterium]MBT7288895.1 hypothetical protein [Chloroflexota bacterium]
MKSRTNSAVKDRPASQKAKQKAVQTIEQPTCVHYWIVGHPKHGYCKAICKYCGERRSFESSFGDTRWSGEMPTEYMKPLSLQNVDFFSGESY